jgi:arylsulfatase A-like enzyme
VRPALLPALLALAACPAEAPAPAPTAARPAAAPAGGPRPGVPPPPTPRGGPGGPGGPSGPPVLRVSPEFQLGPAPAGRPHRNIVLVSLDTVGAPFLALHGGPARLPTLEGLAAAGVAVDAAITHQPETCAAHWAMMTGVPPLAHGDVVKVRGSALSVPTLAEIATHQGYKAGAFYGGFTVTDEACGLGRGFTHQVDRVPRDHHAPFRPGNDVVDDALAWMRAQSGPTFTFIHLFDAHFPDPPSPAAAARFATGYRGSLDGSDGALDPFRHGHRTPSAAEVAHVRSLYLAEIEELEPLLARIAEAAGPDAILAVTADHGESFGHNHWFNHKDSLWDEVLRVPLVLRGPGVPSGQRVAAPVGLVDLAPTLLTLAGLPVDRRVAGRDLATVWAGGPGAGAVLSHTDAFRPAVGWSRRRLADKEIHQGGAALRFDLAADPAEAHALPAGPPGTIEAEIRAEAARWSPAGAAPDGATRAGSDALLEVLGYVEPSP